MVLLRTADKIFCKGAIHQKNVEIMHFVGEVGRIHCYYDIIPFEWEMGNYFLLSVASGFFSVKDPQGAACGLGGGVF
jgi:hypothetical protein